jgi:hypothetical protein
MHNVPYTPAVIPMIIPDSASIELHLLVDIIGLGFGTVKINYLKRMGQSMPIPWTVMVFGLTVR